MTTPVNRLLDYEISGIDMRRLRAYRLGRLRGELRRLGLAGCVLFQPLNIRYAVGLRGVPFGMHISSSYVFVPVEGPVVLFGYGKRESRALETIDEVREVQDLSFFMIGQRFPEKVQRCIDELADLAKRHGKGSVRLAIDYCDPELAYGLAKRGIWASNAQEAMERARALKSPDELACMAHALMVAEVGMARMRDALEPGLTENELWSLLYQTNIAMNGEWIEDRALASGERINPWGQGASDRVIRAGELVAFDTDMIGPFSYCADVSRTFHCGPGKPTGEQRTLYAMAYEELHHNLELVKPGVSFREFSDRTWKRPADCTPNRYIVAAHGIGMCDEWPAIYYPEDYGLRGYDGVIEAGMTLCVESYMGREGGHEGVKLEQQVLVTETGYRPLTNFTFEDALLA
jgi:Xaa-Pro dipeptidase